MVDLATKIDEWENQVNFARSVDRMKRKVGKDKVKLLETAGLFDQISIYAYEVVGANYQTSLNENHRVTEAGEGNIFVVNGKPVSKDGKACECQYYTNNGIPCSHMISVLRHNNSALTIDLIDPHWREYLLSIQNQSLEDDATVTDDDDQPVFFNIQRYRE